MCKDCEEHRNKVNVAVQIQDALKPTGDLLRQGSSPQQKFEDALRTALTRKAVVRIGNLPEVPNEGVSIIDLPDDSF